MTASSAVGWTHSLPMPILRKRPKNPQLVHTGENKKNAGQRENNKKETTSKDAHLFKRHNAIVFGISNIRNHLKFQGPQSNDAWKPKTLQRPRNPCNPKKSTQVGSKIHVKFDQDADPNFVWFLMGLGTPFWQFCFKVGRPRDRKTLKNIQFCLIILLFRPTCQ